MRIWTVSAATLLWTLGLTGSAVAGIHTWDVNEVFSNADGSVQFVELWEANGTPGETGVGGGTITSSANTFPIGQGAVLAPTTNKYYLIATPAFAALPNAPTPDAIINPAGLIPFFDTAGDTVAFGGFDSWTFGAVPTDGIMSLDRLAGIGPNTPTNYAGDTATVDASPPPLPSTLPAASPIAIVSLMALLGGAGLLVARRRRSE
jgi:hypothetical protein